MKTRRHVPRPPVSDPEQGLVHRKAGGKVAIGQGLRAAGTRGPGILGGREGQPMRPWSHARRRLPRPLRRTLPSSPARPRPGLRRVGGGSEGGRLARNLNQRRAARPASAPGLLRCASRICSGACGHRAALPFAAAPSTHLPATRPGLVLQRDLPADLSSGAPEPACRASNGAGPPLCASERVAFRCRAHPCALDPPAEEKQRPS